MTLEEWKDAISGNHSFETLISRALEEAGDSPQTYFKPCKTGYKLADSKADSEREALLNHRDPKVAALMGARAAMKSWPNHIARVNRLTRMAQADGGKLPINLKYSGAHTRRWSGSDGVNVQNLGSKSHELVNAVREVIMAPPEYILAIADSSQIEARVLAWVAGQWDLVTKFANNEEIYCGFASKVLGYHVRKPKKTGGIPAIEQRMGWARNSIGKVGILGCGYGMGPAKAEGYAQGTIDFATAENIVKTYRQEHQAITQFWKDIEKAFIYTAKYKQPCRLARGLDFRSVDDCGVIITLPNGGELKYHHVKIEPGQYGDTVSVYNDQTHTHDHLWGGALTENVVQAISRDVLAEALLRVEARGYHIAMHVHDELVACVPENQGEAALACEIEELSRRPVWAPELPLGAEGKLSQCYTGH